ncbi:hypothetical protein AAMO2058_001390100 [Amorphochlora amoebiformis]
MCEKPDDWNNYFSTPRRIKLKAPHNIRPTQQHDNTLANVTGAVLEHSLPLDLRAVKNPRTFSKGSVSRSVGVSKAKQSNRKEVNDAQAAILASLRLLQQVLLITVIAKQSYDF